MLGFDFCGLQTIWWHIALAHVAAQQTILHCTRPIRLYTCVYEKMCVYIYIYVFIELLYTYIGTYIKTGIHPPSTSMHLYMCTYTYIRMYKLIYSYCTCSHDDAKIRTMLVVCYLIQTIWGSTTLYLAEPSTCWHNEHRLAFPVNATTLQLPCSDSRRPTC